MPLARNPIKPPRAAPNSRSRSAYLRAKARDKARAPARPPRPGAARPRPSSSRRDAISDRARERYESIPDIPGINPTGRLSIGAAKKIKAAWAKQGRPRPYKPAEPLTGKAFAEELKAAEQLKYGDADREADQEIGSRDQATRNVGTYYDDYRAALTQATGRVNAATAQGVQAAEARTDTAHAQDAAGVADRDAAASAQAKQLGRAPVQSQEGAQAVSAARSQGNLAAAGLRQQASVHNQDWEQRGTNAVQAKAEAYQRATGEAQKARTAKADITKDKGAFRVDFRNKSRESEREWLALQKEFGLKEAEAKTDTKDKKAQRKVDIQKAAANVLIARLNSSANKARASATIRVAKIQLEKGKIDQKQYKEITNIYKGLPGKGSSGGGKGGGADPRDFFDTAVNDIKGGKRPKGAATMPGIAKAASYMAEDKAIPNSLRRAIKRKYNINLPGKKEPRRPSGGVPAANPHGR